ncbi:uncharacterized protein LOC132194626 [Neocloeon triangulifer]|uniref:uncharacterized protein LOC132194626 n=1 Tax=Neocloeon triangulifer TaxID=2078957 RepID=UPI00286EF68E|nr:uncharacterized protein LOC132194626 [Neocloeon triangulifer]
MMSQDAQLSRRLNPPRDRAEPKDKEAEQPDDAPEAAAVPKKDAGSDKTAFGDDDMSCALRPQQGLVNPFMQPDDDADELAALQTANEIAFAANVGPGAAPAPFLDFPTRDLPTDNSNFLNFHDTAFNSVGFGFADYLCLANDNLKANSKAHYMSANCVVFTNYTSGNAAAEVDQHFSRALGALNKDQAFGQAILGKPSLFDFKGKMFPPGFGTSVRTCPARQFSKKNINSLQLPSSSSADPYANLNQSHRHHPWNQQMLPPLAQGQHLPSYSAFNAYWSGQYHSVSCPNTPLQHSTAHGQQAFQFNSTITTGSGPSSTVPQHHQRDYWY